MNELERDLRTLLESKAADASITPRPPARVLKRARRRQVGTVLGATVGTVAIVAASIVGFRALDRTDVSPPRPAVNPVLPDAPEGFRSACGGQKLRSPL